MTLNFELTSNELMNDFLDYSKYSIWSKDVDPVYDVLKAIHRLLGYGEGDRDNRVKHTFWYLSWYNLMSAQEAWNYVTETGDELPDYNLCKLPTGIERRGFRDGYQMMKHMESLQKIAADWNNAHNRDGQGWFDDWIAAGFTNNAKVNWGIAYERLQTVYGNGRWAAYKGCELLQKVCGLNLEPPDMGHKGSSGPRKGLAMLFRDCPAHGDQSAQAIELLDRMSDDLLDHMRKWYSDNPVVQDLGVVETCLCDFHSMAHGGYYVGHDIDLMQEGVSKSKAPQEVKDLLWNARAVALPHHYLGELGGWNGVDKDRKRAYRDQNVIMIRGELE
jgi:hypothetical protein